MEKAGEQSIQWDIIVAILELNFHERAEMKKNSLFSWAWAQFDINIDEPKGIAIGEVKAVETIVK